MAKRIVKAQMKKAKKSALGIAKGIGPFTQEDEFDSCILKDKE